MDERDEAAAGRDSNLFAPLAIIAAVVVCFGLYQASAVFIPIAFALFIIAVTWPVQRVLQARMPRVLAACLTVAVTLMAILVLGYLLVWGFNRVGEWLFANLPRFQALYEQAVAKLEKSGLMVVGPLSDYFDFNSGLRLLRQLGSHLQGITTFALVTAVYVLLGLLEVDQFRAKLERMRRGDVGPALIRVSADVAAKMQTYMVVRTAMSVMTGVVIWAFALVAGLELATAWGVIAFALNYIPFLGPLVATVFPTAFALLQFESWQTALLVFVVLNLIQFVIGSYLEPRVSGAALAISPFMVLFAVFFWTYLWGIAGTFIGVPVTIALIATVGAFEKGKWLADVMREE
jgi:AI-2 transport protein TqsA